VSETTS